MAAGPGHFDHAVLLSLPQVLVAGETVCRVERRACDAGRGAGREAGGREAAAAQAACTEIEGRRTRAGRTVARQLLLVAVKARVVWQLRHLQMDRAQPHELLEVGLVPGEGEG